MSSPDDSPQTDEPRTARVHEIVNDCLLRRAAGDVITDKSVIEAHPELMPELAEQLRNLRMIQEAERQSPHPPASGLRIRCPHCRNPLEIVEDTSLSDVVCPSCGSHFSLVEEAERTFQARRHQHINHFQLLDKVGVGAFGSVWSAKDTQLDRIVALKLPRKGQLRPEDTESFIREARAAAQLKHPNIVSVLEVGRHEDRLYIACDFVRGLDLADWLTDQRPTPREAAELCATVADALQHAHEHGVIHRDLKPSNIMLDTSGEPHLMDFGLAKREVGEITMTVEGKLLGTPAYMSPEQARGDAHDADARSDVYSLGVILFELLTGARPFRGNTRMLLHQVLAEDAPSPRKLNSSVPRDLETVCLKCLEKEPRRRYQTASAFRDDLRRFLRGEPVEARPISPTSRAWKWCKRFPARASLTCLILLLAIVGPLVALKFGSLAQEEMRARRRAEVTGTQLRRLLYVSDMAVAQKALQKAKIGTVIELLERHIPHVGDQDCRGFEWYLLWESCKRTILSPVLDHGYIMDLDFSRDGQSLLYINGHPPNVIGRNVASSSVLDVKPFDAGWLGPVARISNDHNFFAIGHESGIVHLANLGGGEVRTLKGNRSTTFALDFSPDDRSVLVGFNDGTIALWDTGSGELISTKQAHSDAVYCTAFSPDGRFLATGSRDETAKLWRTDNFSLFATFRVGDHCETRSSVWSVAFSPDAKTIATGTSGDFAVLLWDVTEGRLIHKFVDGDAYVRALDFSPNGDVLASAGRTIRLWDVAGRRPIDALRGEVASDIWCLAFSPDGKLLASGANDKGEVKIWPLDVAANPRVRPHPDNVRCGAMTDDGRSFATAGEGGEVNVWDVSAGEIQRRLRHGAAVQSVAFGSDGSLVSGGIDMTAKLWNVDTGELRATFRHKAVVLSVAISPSADTLATGTTDGALSIWDLRSGTLTRRVKSHSASMLGYHDLAFVPDGTKVAYSGHDSLGATSPASVKFWDVASGRLMQSIDDVGPMRIAFSKSGGLAAFASAGGYVLLWDTEAHRVVHRLTGHEGPASAICFSRDGKYLFSSDKHTVKIWDVETGTQQFEMDAHDDTVTYLAMTPDGNTLITGSTDDTVKIWKAATDVEVDELRKTWREAHKSNLSDAPGEASARKQ